ncbi:unnamed protein product [Discula destructiva]
MSGRGAGKKQYPSILPAPSSSGSGSIVPGHTRAPELPPKRQKRAGAGRFACDACRLRKSACDGQQPSCSTCTKRKAQCVYAPRQEPALSQEEHAELNLLRQQKESSRMQDADTSTAAILERLRTLPEDQALELFHELRATGAGYYAHVITTDDIRPPSPFSVGFELMIRHPSLFPVISTEKPMILAVANATAPRDRVQSGDEDFNSFLKPLPLDLSKLPNPSSENREGSSHSIPNELCDERLRQFDVHNWLQVPAAAELAASAISFYLTTWHPILGLFDVDLFLRDLIAQRTDFCSPLLLSAVLALACQGYAATDPEAASLSHDFFVEAERLYREEKTGGPQYESATMTTAAALLLCTAATSQAQEDVAAMYLFDGIQMAHQNGLLAVTKRYGARHWLDGDIELVRAAAHTAWGTFCTTMLLGVNYWKALIDIQPWLPIPGTTIDRGGGNVVDFALPSYMGNSFTELCKLAPMINKILHQYRFPPATRTPFDMAEETYVKLLEWADSLPIAMGSGRYMLDHVAIVHIYFHTAILDLFRPSLHQNPKQSLELDIFTAEHRTVEDVCVASINQLKHLLLIFRTRYPSAVRSMLWHNALLYVANDCFASLPVLARTPEPGYKDTGSRVAVNDSSNRVWFLACIDGYKALRPQFAFVSSILQGLLNLGIMNGLITAAEGRAYMDGAWVSSMSPSQIHAEHEQQRGMHGQSPGASSEAHRKNTFILDLNGAMADPTAASVDSLSRSFDQVAMFDEVAADDHATSSFDG